MLLRRAAAVEMGSKYNAIMKLAWCWRCKKDVPMIDEAEWQALWTRTADKAVLDECRHLTGLPPDLATRKLMLSHRISHYGEACPNCGKLLGTPRAAFCAECGHKV